MSSVFHDATLQGAGTSASPLGIAPGGVSTTQLANTAVTGAKIAPGTVVRSLNGLSDNVSLLPGLYWLTNSATSSAPLYWENNNNFNAAEQKTADISIPVAVTVFPGELYRAPKSWAERSYHKLGYFNEVDKGGHFSEKRKVLAAWCTTSQAFCSALRSSWKSFSRWGNGAA